MIFRHLVLKKEGFEEREITITANVPKPVIPLVAKKEEITEPSVVEPKKTIKKNATPKLKKPNAKNQRKETTPTKKSKGKTKNKDGMKTDW